MFARRYRLPHYSNLTKATTSHTAFFVVKIVSNSLPYNRYGFIAGKAIDKRAVVRNRLKRQFRAGIEGMHKDLKKGYDLLFILKKSGINADSKQLHEEAKGILEKLGI